MSKINTQITIFKPITFVLSCLVLVACSFSGGNTSGSDFGNDFKLQKYSNQITKSEFSSAMTKVKESYLSCNSLEDSFEIKKYAKESFDKTDAYSYAVIKYDSNKLILRDDTKGESSSPGINRKFLYSNQTQFEDGFRYSIDIPNKFYFKTEATLELYKQHVYSITGPFFNYGGDHVPWSEGSPYTDARFYADKNETLFTCIANIDDGHNIFQFDIRTFSQYYERKNGNSILIDASSFTKKDINLSRIDYTEYKN